jgi:thioredoxin-dependent peroxiredoxin
MDMQASGLVTALLAAAALASAQAPAGLQPAGGAGPREGDAAPAFSLPSSDGRTYSLAEFKGKRAVVLAWFPKAFTSG